LAKQKLVARGEHVCPACDHHWPIAQELDHPDWQAVQECEPPQLTMTQINAAAKVVSNEAAIEQMKVDHAQRWERMQKDYVEDVRKAEEDFESAMARYTLDVKTADDELATVAQKLTALTAQLEGMPDRTEDLKKRRVYEAEMFTFNENKRVYDNFMADYPRKRDRAKELENIEATVESIITRAAQAKQYETETVAFATTLANYEEKVALKDALLAQAEDLARAKTAVQEAKVVIKSFLVPSLNQVSSLLISQMTGGVRNNITISEDFDIQVDGQDIATLSGSGKAVANLAIRIGLGQIMTNSIFSSFQADEVDEGMDDERAAFTAECLRRLSPAIRQVILVTHKRPIADHIYELPLKQ
jgi:DNA repair exonuclease SbcCD ATPase subunit